MTKKRIQLKGTIVLLGLVSAAAVLAGCQDATYQDYNPFLVGQWRQMPAQEENHVEFVTIEHVVAFAPSAIRPGDAELGRLLDFIDGSDVNSLDEIQLDAPRTANGTHDAVTAARLEVIEGELLQLGLPVVVADTPLTEVQGGENQVAVLVERAVAVPPDCEVPQPGLAQKPDWKPGCANTAVLGHMVADPRDLVKGRTLDPADGEMAAKAIENYRNPESEEGQSGALIIETTTGKKQQ